MFLKFLSDESGVIISAELILVLTIAVLGMVVGLSEVSVAVNSELNDISNAIGAMNQSYAVTGFRGIGFKLKSFTSGTTFFDFVDDCDFNSSCDLVCGAPPVQAGGDFTGFGG